MPNLHVLHTCTGKEPDPTMLALLCNGDISAKLTDCGLDLRPYFALVPTPPMQVHVNHGHYDAAMHRPTWRRRIAARLHSTEPSILFGFVVCGLFLAYMALEVVRWAVGR